MHIDRIQREIDELPPGDERDLTVVDLADARRGQALDLGPEYRAVTPEDVDRVRTTAFEIGCLMRDVRHPLAVCLIGAVRALTLAWTLRHDPTDDELRSVITDLEDALDPLDAELPFHDEVCAQLGHAYVRRFQRSGVVEDLDRAIGIAARAGDQEEFEVREALAWAHHERWDLAGRPDDLDRAIEHWRALLAVFEAPPGQAVLGQLLFERAEVCLAAGAGSGADVDEAVVLLEAAAAGGQEVWWELGTAHQMRRQAGGDITEARRAAECMDLALAGPESPEFLLEAYPERLMVANDLVCHEMETDPAGRPPSGTDLLRIVAAARQVWDSGVGDHDSRVRLAGLMAVNAPMAWYSHPEAMDGAWMVALVAFCRTLPDKPAGWDALLDAVDVLARFTDQTQRGEAISEETMALLVRPLRDAGTDTETSEMLRRLVPMFLVPMSLGSGDRRLLRAAVEQLRTMDDPDAHDFADTMELIDRARNGDASVQAALRARRERMRVGPSSYMNRVVNERLLTMIESVFDAKDGVYQPVDHSPVRAGDQAGIDRAVIALPGPMLTTIVRHDVAAMRDCADRIDELLAVLPAEHAHRLVLCGWGTVLGVSLLRDQPADQDMARRVLCWTEGGRSRGDARNSVGAELALGRAEALRHLAGGDRAESRRWGLAGLHGFWWQVLLQSGTDDAVLAAAQAGERARRVAGWCWADGAAEDLVAALDAGRGLVLAAATASRTIADRLVAAGRPELAEQWRASAGYGADRITGSPLTSIGAVAEVPDRLRAEVLEVLGLGAPEPASLADIRAALVAAGRDALVYLMPATAGQAGAAVVVPSAGEVRIVPLPGLITGSESELARHTATVRGGRDLGLSRPPGEGGDVYGWAWSAAMREVLRDTGPLRPGAAVRLVLVPTGALSAVPWHAAVSETGRYVIKDAVISYAVSARAFVETAREPARPVNNVLIVGDPTGDLPWAGVEARAIGRAFYPYAALHDTADQVLDWVARSAPGPSLLHLACHGHADPARPAAACLRLAGGDLSARQLIEASRVAELEIEQVFLAACVTGMTGEHYDEAFSLATAFLAAGARTVFASLWEVPDAETSVLMFLVHHYLVTTGCPPADALRRAQLWMLDPDRVAPPGLPAELRTLSGPAPAAPSAWAAFTHQGR